MFFAKNKFLLMGAVAAALVWAGVNFILVQPLWEESAKQFQDAKDLRASWLVESYDQKKVPVNDAEQALKENDHQQQLNLKELQKIEFGTPETLRGFSEEAAGTGDKNNYFDTLRKQIVTRAKDSYKMTVPVDLNIVGTVADSPISLKLLRLGLVDRFLSACKEAGVPLLLRIKYEAPSVILNGREPSPEDSRGRDKDKAKDDKPAGPDERLAQIPMRVEIVAPERSVAKLLYELQKPTEANRGFFSLRGFHVAVRDSASGMVDASIAVSALMRVSCLNKMNVQPKDDSERRGGPARPEYDFGRY